MALIAKLILDILYRLPMKFLLKNYILFESNPDYSDNTYYVYKELLNQGYNDKYVFIWLVDDVNRFKNINIKNVKFVNMKKSFYYRLFAKYIIDCNRYVPKKNKNQYRIYLGHGVPIKIAKDYIKTCGNLDNYLVTSDFFGDFFSKYSGKPRNIFCSLGYPRCDQFFQDKAEFEDLKKYNKVIVWMPTFRKYKDSGIGYDSKLLFCVPSVNSKEQLIKLNKIFNKKNSLLLIKIHPAEDISFLKEFNLSNIKFIKNGFLEKNNNNVYELLQVSDALITDYSSVYFDYLLLDRPIGMAIEDLETYKKYNEVQFNDFEEQLPAEYIYNFDDLLHFLNNVFEGKDVARTRRNNKMKLYNDYCDGGSSKRVVELLKKHSL